MKVPSLRPNLLTPMLRVGASGPALLGSLGDQVVGIGILTLAYGYTVQPGAKVLVVFAKNDGPDPTTMTLGGQSFTKYLGLNNTTYAINISAWYLLNPTPGAGTITMIVTSNGGSLHATATADYGAVNTAGNPEAGGSVNAISATPSVPVTTLTDNDLIIMGGLASGGVATPGANTRQVIAGGYGLWDNIGNFKPAGATTMNLTLPSNSNTLIAMAFKQ